MNWDKREFEREVRDETLQLHYKIDGYGPVQAQGTLQDKSFYFRAKYDTWDFTLVDAGEDPTEWKVTDNSFQCSGPYGKSKRYDASYMNYDDVANIVLHCVQLYLISRGNQE